MIKETKVEKRNLGVTVIAGTISLVAIMIASNVFPTDAHSLAQIAYFAFASFVALLAFAIAIYGRKKALKNLIDAILNFSI
jgi:hypothetical protein